jgi:plastocyanin
MQKRILSLFLVLCMVLALVPALMLPLMATEAEEENFVTKFSENIPTITAIEVIDENNKFPYAFEYHGSWTAGRKTAANAYERYNTITNQPHHILTTKQDDQWSTGGFYIDAFSGGATGGRLITPKGVDTAIQYKAIYTGTVTVEVNDLFFSIDGSYFGVFVNGQMIWPNAGDYYADNTKWLTGAKEINYGSNGEADGKFGAAIEIAITAGDVIEFVNRTGEEATETPFGYHSPEFTITYTERTASAFSSSYGTDFSFASYNTDGVKWNTSPTLPQEWDTETMGELTPETLDAYLQNFFMLGQTNRGYGNWTMGVFDEAKGTFAPLTRINGIADRLMGWEYDHEGTTIITQLHSGQLNGHAGQYDLAWGITEAGYQSVIDAYVAGAGDTSPWGGAMGAAWLTVHGAVQPSTGNTIVAYQYTAPESGTATFSFDKISAKAAAAVAIFVNNVKVWPEGDAWYNAFTDNVANDTAAINAALAEVSQFVLEGDEIRFAVKKNAWLGSAEAGNGCVFHPAVSITNEDPSKEYAIISYQDMAGNEVARYICNVGDAMPNPNLLVAGYDYTGDGIADEIPATVTGSMTFTATSDIAGVSRFDKNAPTVGDGNVAVFTGNWKTVKGLWNVDYAVDTETDLFWTYMQDMDTYSAPAFVGTDAGMWTANGGGCYAADRKFAVRKTESLVGVGAMYTVPYSGVVDLYYTNMQAKREANSSTAAAVISQYFAILLNGEVIWPSNGTPWLYTSAEEYSETQKQIDVLADAQAYEAFPTNITVSAGDEIAFIGNMGNPQTWMSYFDGAVAYTDLINISVDAGVSLGDAFGVDFYISAEEDATEYGLEYDGELIAADEDGIVSIGGIAAKELIDEIVVVPYQVIGETTVYGEEIVTTVADLLYEYVDCEIEPASNVAIAMLNYGAAAQTYFNYYASKLANANLTAEQQTVAYTGTYTPGTAIDLEGATVDLQSVTLLLESYINLKFVVDSKEEGLQMEVGLDADFTESMTLDMEQTKDKTGYKLIGETDVLSWNNTCYFRVVDAEGNPVSRTIAYSVTAYCAKMVDNEEVNIVTNAILALYEASVAYYNAAE